MWSGSSSAGRRSRATATSSTRSTGCGGPVQWAWHMILPWITFAMLFAALYVRMIRANVMEASSEDYVRTARAKGAPEHVVIRSHILRNALLPVVTMLGMDIGVALGGAIFTETIFALPGLGSDGADCDHELRPADGAGCGRVRHDRDHRVQPRRRPPVRRNRPQNPTLLGGVKGPWHSSRSATSARISAPTTAWSGPSTASASRSRRARRSGSSASPAPARASPA